MFNEGGKQTKSFFFLFLYVTSSEIPERGINRSAVHLKWVAAVHVYVHHGVCVGPLVNSCGNDN